MRNSFANSFKLFFCLSFFPLTNSLFSQQAATSKTDILERLEDFDVENFSEENPVLNLMAEPQEMQWDEKRKVFYTNFPGMLDFGGWALGNASIKVSPIHRTFTFSGEINWHNIPIKLDMGNYFTLPSTIRSKDFGKQLEDIKTLKIGEAESAAKKSTEELTKKQGEQFKKLEKEAKSKKISLDSKEYADAFSNIDQYGKNEAKEINKKLDAQKNSIDKTYSQELFGKEKRLHELQKLVETKDVKITEEQKQELSSLVQEVGGLTEGIYYYKVPQKKTKGFYVHGTLPFKSLKPFEKTNLPGLKDVTINDIRVYFDFSQNPLGIGFGQGGPLSFLPRPTVEVPGGVSLMLGGSITALNTEAFGLFGFTYIKDINSFAPIIKMGIPSGWSLGKSIPAVKDTILDLIKLEKVNFAITPLGHIDPEMGRLNSGFNMNAILLPSGPIEKLNKLLGSPFSKYIVSGSVGYSLKDIALKAAIPFTIPIKSSVVKAGSVAFSIKGDPLAYVGLETELYVLIKNDPTGLLSFGTDIGIEMDKKLGPIAVLSGYMSGNWENVFGVLGVNISNVAISTKFLPEAGIPTAMGITGAIEIANKKVLLGLNLSDDPKELLILGQLNGEISLKDVIDFTKEVGKRTYDFLKDPRQWAKGGVLMAGATATAAGLFLPAAAFGAGISVVFDKIVSRFPIPEKAIPNLSIKDIKILISPFGGLFTGAAFKVVPKLTETEKGTLEKGTQEAKKKAEFSAEFLVGEASKEAKESFVKEKVEKYEEEFMAEKESAVAKEIQKEQKGARGTPQEMYEATKRAAGVAREKLESVIKFDRFDKYGKLDVLGEMYGNYFNPPMIGPFQFEHGFTIKGLVTILRTQTYVDFNVSYQGFWAKGAFSEIKFGPLTITGPGMAQIGQHLKKGPIIDIEVSKNNIGAKIQGYASMWGMKSLTDIKIDSEGMNILLYGKMFGLLEGTLNMQSEGDLDDPDFVINAKFSDKTYEQITGLATNLADSLVKSASGKKEDLQKEINILDEQIEQKKKLIEAVERGETIKQSRNSAPLKKVNNNDDPGFNLILQCANDAYEKYILENSLVVSSDNSIAVLPSALEKPLELAVLNPFNKKDREIAKLTIELKGLQAKRHSLVALQKAISGGSKIAELGLKGGGKAAGFAAEQVSGMVKGATAGALLGPVGVAVGTASVIGLQIREISLKGRLKDIMNGKMPTCTIKTGIFGREQTASFQFNVLDPRKSFEEIYHGVAKLILGV